MGKSTKVNTIKVYEPGNGRGRTAVAIISGEDSNFVRVSMNTPGAEHEVETWIVSRSMPEDTRGLIISVLPDTCQKFQFSKYMKYFQKLAARWYDFHIFSPDTEFISLLFLRDGATIYICKLLPGHTGRNVNLKTKVRRWFYVCW
jgi:hypothetical protein